MRTRLRMDPAEMMDPEMSADVMVFALYTSLKPVHYFIYVDNTLLLFRSPEHINKFLEYLNNKHPNIKFTCDVENNGSLPFLDINISRNDNSFVTSVFRKPTYTGLTTKFSSYIPTKYKGNLISTLIYRAYLIFSSEIDFITNILRKNEYPLNFIYRNIKKTLNNLITPHLTPLTVPKDKIYMKLPYLGSASFNLERKLTSLIRKHYATVDLKLIFTASQIIGNLFKFKDRIPKPLRSSIIYKYACGNYNAAYIGKTSRNLFMRVEEHRGFSFRNNNIKLSRPMKSSIRDHSEIQNHKLT
nr:uncharacterized protein LOC113820983 [Penaeus vannamei]